MKAMADTPAPSPESAISPPIPPARKGARRLRWIAGALGLAIAAAVALLLVLTSDTGIRRVILPWLSQKLGAEISAARVAWRPLSSMTIEQLRIGPAERPWLAVERLSLRYRGWKAFRGRLEIAEIQIDAPSLHLLQDAEGAFTNLPPALQPADKSSEKPSPSGKSPAPFPIPAEIDRLVVRNLRLVCEAPDSRFEIGPAELAVREIRPGGAAALECRSTFSWKAKANASKSSAQSSVSLAGQARANLSVNLDETFLPRAAKGEFVAENLTGHAGAERLDGCGASLQVDFGLGADGKGLLREARLTVTRQGTPLTTARVAGPLDLAGKEAELDVQIGPVDRSFLNLVFGEKRLDFGPTRLSYTGHIALRKAGAVTRAEGRLVADPFSVSSPRIPSGVVEPIRATLEHSVEVDARERHATIALLNLQAQRAEGQPLLRGALSRPMTLSWREGPNLAAPAEDAEFNLELFPIEIPPLAPILSLPENWRLGSGALAASLKVSATEQGRQVALEGRLGAARLALSAPELAFADVTLQLIGRATLRDLKTLHFEKTSLRFTEKGEELAEAILSGAWELPTQTGSGRVTLSMPIPPALALRPVAGLSVSSGDAKIAADWKRDAKGQLLARATASLQKVSATWNGIRYARLGAQFNALLGWRDAEFQANDARFTLLLGDQSAGVLLGNALWNARTGVFRSHLEASEWNAPSLAPIFAKRFPGRELRSLQISGQADLAHDGAALAFHGKADLKNFAVGDQDAASTKPLNATLAADASWGANGLLTIRSATLQMDPVGRSKNRLELSGALHSTPTLQFANLKVRGQSLDLTPWAEQLFPTNASAATTAAAAPPDPKTSAGPAAASAPSAPTPASAAGPARALDLTLDVKVDALKIRDFRLTDLVFPLRIQGDVFDLPDARAALDGAPVSATVRTEKGAGGGPAPFRFEAKGENLALGPLVDAFAPTLRGQIGGTLTLRAYGNGRGLSREALEQNLSGHLEIAARGAHLEKTAKLHNALAQLGALLESPEIAASTIDDLDGSAKIGAGRLTTDNFHAKGSALEASLRGEVFFDQRLALEAAIKMKRSAMSKSSLLAPIVQAASAEQGDWIRIPGGAKVTGTLDAPEIAVDKSKFARDTLINTGVNFLKQMLQKPDPAASTNAPPSAAPPARQENPVQNLLDLFKKK